MHNQPFHRGLLGRASLAALLSAAALLLTACGGGGTTGGLNNTNTSGGGGSGGGGGGGTGTTQVSLPVSFDTANVNYTTNSIAGGSGTVVADPAGGSAHGNVLQVTISGQSTYDGVSLVSTGAGLAQPVGFSNAVTQMTVDVYSANPGTPILLKVENHATASVCTAALATTTQTNAWETLTFEFKGSTAGGCTSVDPTQSYDLISVFPNFGTQVSAAQNYFVDNIALGTGTASLAAAALPVTFDSATTSYATSSIGAGSGAIVAAPAAASSHGNVLQLSVGGSGATTYDGATLVSLGSGLSAPVAFTNTVTSLTVDSYAPAAGIPILLKVENVSSGATCVAVIANTTQANTWETLTFDFANGTPAGGCSALNTSNSYQKISIFPDFGTAGSSSQNFYFDNIALGAANTKTPQTITFTTAATGTVGGSISLSATATSGLTVSFGAAPSSVCTITGGTTLNYVAAGTCTVTASQGGDATYNAAPSVPITVTISTPSTLTFLSGYDTSATIENGAWGGYGGSDAGGGPGFGYGAFVDNSTAANAAASAISFYYSPATAPASYIYFGMYVQAPNTNGNFNAAADNQGLALTGSQSSMLVNLAINAEFLNNTNGHNIMVQLTMGKYYSVGGGGNCYPLLRYMLTPTATTVTAYSIPLSSFIVAQNCGDSSLSSAAAVLALSQGVAQIDFQADDLGAAITIGPKVTNANTTVLNYSNPSYGYPTAFTLQGAITFQ